MSRSPSLKTLAIELVLSICEHLDRDSLCHFALVSHYCFEVADQLRIKHFKSIQISVKDERSIPETLDRCLQALEYRKGVVEQITLKQYSENGQCEDWAQQMKALAVFTNNTTATVEDRNNAWQGLVGFLREFPRLNDLVWDVDDQIPDYVLAGLDQRVQLHHHTLYLGNVSYRTLSGDRVPGRNPRLPWSNQLHSITIAYKYILSLDPFTANPSWALVFQMLSGGAPNLKSVKLVGLHPESGPGHLVNLIPTPNGPDFDWPSSRIGVMESAARLTGVVVPRSLIMFPKEVRPGTVNPEQGTNRLTRLELAGDGPVSYQFAGLLAWGSHFTLLETLKIDGIDFMGLKALQLVAKVGGFPRLKSLWVRMDHDKVNLFHASWPTQDDEEMSRFVSALQAPSLKSIGLVGRISWQTLEAVLKTHGPKLRQLEFWPSTGFPLATMPTEAIEDIEAHCHVLEELKVQIDPSEERSRLYETLGRMRKLRRLYLGLDCRGSRGGDDIPHPDLSHHTEHAHEENHCLMCRDDVTDSILDDLILQTIITPNDALEELRFVHTGYEERFDPSTLSCLYRSWKITRDASKPTGFAGTRGFERLRRFDVESPTSPEGWRPIQILNPFGALDGED